VLVAWLRHFYIVLDAEQRRVGFALPRYADAASVASKQMLSPNDDGSSSAPLRMLSTALLAPLLLLCLL
jgi:chemotaxis signal transduction protein